MTEDILFEEAVEEVIEEVTEDSDREEDRCDCRDQDHWFRFPKRHHHHHHPHTPPPTAIFAKVVLSEPQAKE